MVNRFSERCGSASAWLAKSFQQVRLFAGDALPQGLKLEPAGHGRSDLTARNQRILAIDGDGLACGFRQKLRLATAVHGDEPPGRFVDSFAHGEQPVIAQNRCLARTKRARDSFAFAGIVDDACEVVEDRVILKKRASILRDGIEQAAK